MYADFCCFVLMFGVIGMCLTVLQCVAVSVLQCVAVCSRVLL